MFKAFSNITVMDDSVYWDGKTHFTNGIWFLIEQSTESSGSAGAL